MSKSNFSRVLSVLLLAIVAVMIGQGRAYAASTFTVTNSDNTFTVTRRGNTAVAEDVNYRTVSLSAIEGQHFTAASGTLSFAANDTSKTVTVTESTPGTDAYKFQSGTTRSYRFEVLDSDGYILASKDRSMTTGTSVPSSGAFDIKDVTIYSSEYTANDDGYDKNGYKSVSSSAYFTSSNAPKAYLQQISAQLRMTLSFQGKENDDAYEYLQLLFDNTSTCDNRSGCSNGDPGNISLSTYMAGFEMNTDSKDDTYRDYTFPVTSVGNNEGATDPWGYGTKWPLSKQKFNSSRASDGRIIMPMNFSSIVLRLNASGSSGSDEWAVKNVTAHIQAVDPTAPTVLSNYKVSGGRHQKGNVIYVSVAFSEIVTVSGTPTLATSWGTLSYCAGSGSNVLTFSGQIADSATGTLSVTGHSGTIKDLVGNAFSGTISKDFGTSLDADYAWTEADFNSLGTNTYEIATKTDLRHLALLVNAAKNPCTGLTFRQTQDITCDDTYIPIGYHVSNSDEARFRGTYDGYGHTVSGITVSRTGTGEANGYVGLFGYVDNKKSTDYGTVKNVVLANSAFTGKNNVGGIVGYNAGGTVQNCRVESSVTINAGYNNAYYHGGIVGNNHNSDAKVIGCYSAAAVSANGKSACQFFGGIVGGGYKGTVKDCLYAGTTVTAANNKGAIIGYDEDNHGVFSNNYYTAINLGGVGADGSSSDQDGARRARTVSLGTGVALSGTETSYDASGLTAIGTTALQSGSTIYSGEGQTVNVAYSGTVPEGFIVTYSATAGSISGNVLTMADADVTVSATCAPDYATHWHADADHDGTTAARAYIITTTTGLNLLATLVNGYGYSTFEGTYFLLGNDITYSHTTDWNDATSTENNYTAIGSWRSGTTYNQFKGNFDGDGHTISGIRIYKPESSTGNGYTGLFGYVGTGGSIHDVNLADARITGQLSVAGIAGLSYGTVTNCTVAADVLVASKHTSSHYHAGIVGNNHGTVSGCTSTVTLTAAYTDPDNYGAVVGINYSDGTVENCFAHGATIPAMQDYYGVIVGNNSSGILTANYYRDCTVGTTANAVGVGAGKRGGAPTDVDGARSVHALTLPDGVTATGESVTYNNVIYCASTSLVTLSPVPGLSITGAIYNDVSDHNSTDNGDGTWSFIMPAADVTVSVSANDLWGVQSGCDGSTAEKAYTITTTDGLDLLATLVNNGDDKIFNDKYFRLGADITYSHKADNEEGADTENNYTAIGSCINNVYKSFYGIFDGQGHTVSGIRIYKGGDTYDDCYQGLFGLASGAIIKNVILADARIIGKGFVGGIVGYITKKNGSGGIVENCRVGSDVTIHAVAEYAYSHGGVVGSCVLGTISGCVSSATLTVAGNLINIYNYGGIVGMISIYSSMSDCLAIGVTLPDVEYNGTIAGYVDDYGVGNYGVGNFGTNNYFHDCTVGGNAVASDAYTVSAGTDVTLTPAGTTDATYDYNGIKRYGDALYYGGVLYAPTTAAGNDVSLTLGYTGSVSTGLIALYTATAGTLSGTSNPYTLTMPAKDVTINAITTDVWDIAKGADGTEQNPFTITTTAGLDQLATLVNSGNDFSGKYFRLGADITYDYTTAWDDATSEENNYTTIGNNYRFKGTFDGQGHTISGIRIYMVTTSYQGIFGSASGATIKNVILADARITGRIDVGGIVGQLSRNNDVGGIVENCRVGSDVAIHAAGIYATGHGGVVGNCCIGGTIRGCVSAATLTAADGIVGIGRFGGIAGEHSGDISDCLAIGAIVPAVGNNGAIAGKVNSGSTRTNNYYRNCTVGASTHQSDAYTVSAGTDVTVAPAGDADATYDYNGIKRYGDALYYGGVLYAPEEASVSLTLGYNGSVPTDLSVGYAPSTGSLSISANPYTLTVPDGDVTINAFFGVEVPYIDEKGVEHIATAIPLDNTMMTLAAGTYVVNSDVTYTSTVTTTGTVTLILADGCTMSFDTDNTFIYCPDNLNIYGQVQGTGLLKAYCRDYGISVSKDYTQHSGNVFIRNANGCCIHTGKDFTLLGGTLDLLGGDGCVGDIEAFCFMNIQGGKLWARYKGLNSGAGTNLDYTKPSDLIYAKKYNSIPSIADDKTFVNENGKAISRTLDPGLVDVTNKTLRPVMGVTLTKDGNNISATFSGTSLETVNIPAPGVIVKEVTYNRTFSAGKASTVMLPFDYTCNGNEGGTFYRFVGVEKENNTWVATMQTTADALIANTPYLFLPTGTGITFTIPNEGVTLCTEGGGGGQTADSGSHWTFKGTNSYIKWTTNTNDPDYSAERAAEIGKVYGFAGVDKNEIKAGDFVKVASGAKIRPMSAYLIWSNTANLAPARGGMNAASASADELPKSITVRLINSSGTVTNVGEIDMETGELSFDGWYTLQGVKLDAEPTEPGIYINNGKKVSIK